MRRFSIHLSKELVLTPHKMRAANKIARDAAKAKRRTDQEARENYRRMIGLKDSA